MALARRARHRQPLGAALLVGAVGFAWLGQSILRDRPGDPGDGAIAYLIAVCLFAAAAIRCEGLLTPPLSAGALRPLRVGAAVGALLARRWRLFALGGSVLLTLALLILLRGKTQTSHYWDGLFIWLASAALLAGAALPEGWRNRAVGVIRSRPTTLRTFVRVTGLAALFRFLWLGAHPNVISGDEGRIAGLALATTRGELPNLFGTTFGHSVMYLYLMAVPYHFVGVNPLGYRLLHAVAGSLTVGLTYLLGRRMFDARTGVIAALLLAVSHMHLHFSRIAVAGGIMDALLTTLAVLLFYGGIKSRRAWELVLCGLVVGFHLYVYMGGRLTALFLVPAIALMFVFNRRAFLVNAPGLAGFVLALVLIGAPFAQWSLTHPEQFMDRANQVGIYPTGWLQNEMRTKGLSEPVVLARQLLGALLAFNHYQAVGFYNAELPMLDFFTSIPAALGLGYALLRVREERFLLLNGWFWSSVIVGQVLLVTPERNAYRILMVLPVTMLLAAVGWMKVLALAKWALGPNWRAGMLLTLVFLAAVGYTNLNYYFVRFLPACRFEDPNTRRASILGQYLSTAPRNSKAYVHGPPHYVYGVHPSVDFLSRRLPAMNVDAIQAGGLTHLDPLTRPIFVFVPERRAESAGVAAAFPNGTWRELEDCGRPVLHIYEPPR